MGSGGTATLWSPNKFFESYESSALYCNLALGDALLSHGEAPHYHRRYYVSLLSSEWDQVVPQHYGHQAKFCLEQNFTHFSAPVRVKYMDVLDKFCFHLFFKFEKL